MKRLRQFIGFALGFLIGSSIILIAPSITSRLLFFCLFFIILYEVIVRIRLLKAVNSLEIKYNPIELESIPEIDQSLLRDYTEDLESLGFKVILNSQNSIKLYSRIFTHHEFSCFATLILEIDSSKVGTFCSIGSYLEQDWTIGITNKQPDKTAATSYAFNRLPRSIGIIIPKAVPAKMLPLFLELRQQMMTDLKINIIPDLSLERYQEREQRNKELRQRNLKRKSILYSILERYLYMRSPKLEWYGEYNKFVKQRKRQAG